MSYRSDFVADPLGFMQENVVVQAITRKDSRPLVVTIRLAEGSKVVNKRNGRVYSMTEDTAGLGHTQKLPIHWVGYNSNAFAQGMLNRYANYTFTYAMDGCTFGVGSQSGDGSCLVVHANASNAANSRGGGLADQRAEQRNQIGGVFGGKEHSVISPLQYRATSTGALNFKSTTFGILSNGCWDFYVHRWMNTGGRGGDIWYDEFAMRSITPNYIHGGVQNAIGVAPAAEESSF